MYHVGTHTFETGRLICRRFVSSDNVDMFDNWVTDPDVQLEYGEPVYETLTKTDDLLNRYITGYQNHEFYRWAIIEKDSGKNIGQIAFCRVYSDIRTAEIEYCIGKKFWGKGYAGETLSALIEHTFANTDFIKLEAYHRAENKKSASVLKKSVMHITDSVERFIREGIIPFGEVCYCITKEEYKKL